MDRPQDASPDRFELDDEEEQDEDLDDEDFELPPAHPAFRRIFSDPLYDDQGDEFAPFGSDEGWDAMAEIVEDFTPLDPDVTLRDLAEDVLELEDDEFDATGLDETEDTDFALLGVGFTILRLTGRIDDEGRRRLITAVARQQERFGDELATLRRIAADLEELPAEG
ncbi:hypothetical protein [Amnibacterium kyonggiense]|uniref:hypothetical protein n=1 Tax=Amnibacterium kyonggiense TaxID=595671 RepID=UPI00105B543D|nr:hypothetical protein [Amnibacterium kyonggiense]